MADHDSAPCSIRPTFLTDSHELADRSGQSFEILALTMVEVGGDHPEPMFKIRFPDGHVADGINAECIFSGYSEDLEPAPTGLGGMLAANMARATAENLRRDQARDRARREREGKDRKRAENLIEGAKSSIIEGVEAGLIPRFKVSDYGDQKWVRAAQKGQAENIDVWNGFEAWACDNGLKIIAREEHDGVGMHSWITLAVEPVSSETGSPS